MAVLRPHLALTVPDVERSIPFYRALFGTEPAKVRDGYAKFEVSEPALNFTLNEGNPGDAPGALNHAGIQVEGTLEQVPISGLDASYAINVRAHFVAAKAVLPHMRRQGKGVIINTSSNSGVFFDKGMLAYITSKTAVIAMTKQMALDYGPDNIRVNALCPGWVDTPFNDPYMRQMGGRAALEAYVKDKIPMGRWASVDEIAESILYLASDRSSYMTGHALVVDGGECIA
jgi:NAD(P)-dependent dehydrogenase (short-subunit alcohol dehydrogenase family)